MTQDTVIRVRTRPMKLFVLGGVTGFIALFFLLLLGVLLMSTSGPTSDMWALAAGLVVFSGLTLWLLGLAISRPVALRMDANGISGFYVDPATWDEIDHVSALADSRNKKSLGFAIKDPVGFRDRQTPWRRFISWWNGRSRGHHIVIPYPTLNDTDVETLALQARALKAAAALRQSEL